MPPDFSALQNPLWSALTTAQSLHAIGNSRIKKYRSDLLPFAAAADPINTSIAELDAFILPGEDIVIEEGIQLAAGWKKLNEVVCLQMVCNTRAPVELSAINIEPITTPEDKMGAFDLINIVQPGFTRSNAVSLGDYYGIKVDGKLAAVAGERMHITGLVEVSGVCTLPAHRGKGYAKLLSQAVMQNIWNKGETPFLHVNQLNIGAIRIYESLGFVTERKIKLIRVMKAT